MLRMYSGWLRRELMAEYREYGRHGVGVAVLVYPQIGSVSSVSSANSAWGSVSSDSPLNIKPEAVAVKFILG